MKRFIKNILLAMTLTFAGSLAASSLFCSICPYVGAEFQNTWGQGNGTFWRDNMPPRYAGGTLFVGTRFLGNFGIELGWSRLSSASRRFFVTSGGLSAAGQIRNTFNSLHLDLMGFLSLLPCWELFGTVGVATMSAYPNLDGVGVGPQGFVRQPSINRQYVASRGIIARLGAGLQFQLTDRFGLRATLRWENMSRLNVCGGTSINTAATNGFFGPRPYRDTVSLALGIFINF